MTIDPTGEVTIRPAISLARQLAWRGSGRGTGDASGSVGTAATLLERPACHKARAGFPVQAGDHGAAGIATQRSNPWGGNVSSVEMRDVVIPGALQDAMSREAQAAREKQARIILGEAEKEIAHSFQEAARMYQNNPTALHLRAMNMLYEGLKEKGAMMIVPSSAVESMGMGGLLGAAALRQQSLTAARPEDAAQ